MAGLKSSPTKFGFLLLNDFTLISLSAAVEPLRMANRICDKDIYSWQTFSETGESVSASDGLSIDVNHAIDDKQAWSGLDVMVICSGRRVERNTSRPVLASLREYDRAGIGLGAICTGSYVLAEAGLLDGIRCSIHWENMAALADLHPEVVVSRNVFTINDNRYTSSGGTTPIDMMLHIITERCGMEVSAGVAEQFIYERIRRSDDHQRVPLKHMVGNQSGKLVVAVELMEANIKEPISQQDLADYVGLSTRQLQRLFQRYLLCTPSRYYLTLRLQRARELLRQTCLSVVEISVDTGFVSTSHLSKSYKELYGHSPSAERANNLADSTQEKT